jgi:hypothetical protein
VSEKSKFEQMIDAAQVAYDEGNRCVQCMGELESCRCRPGCPGGWCVACLGEQKKLKPAPEYVRSARYWLNRNKIEQHGKSITLASEGDLRQWCSAIVDQHNQIEALRAALTEAADRVAGWAEQEYRGTSFYDREMRDVERWRKLVTS